MRFSLFDLLIGIVVSTAGFLVGSFLARLASVEQFALLLGLPLALSAYLLITPLIYQRLHLRPLLLPRCPHCKDKNRHFWFEQSKADWPRDVIICGICKTPLELWYEPPHDANVSASMSSFQLIWPQSWGRWRVISHRDLE